MLEQLHVTQSLKTTSNNNRQSDNKYLNLATLALYPLISMGIK